MKKCLIIDFDDTLVSTIDTHADSWRRSLERVLNKEISIESILSDINYGMDVLLKKYQLSPSEVKLAEKFKKQIFSKNLHKTKVNQLLLWICKNGLFEKIYIASNSSRENVDKIMSYHDISPQLFNGIITRDDVENKKPHPDMAHLIFNENDYSEDEYIMVGDSEVDSTFARKNNIECILVKF